MKVALPLFQALLMLIVRYSYSAPLPADYDSNRYIITYKSKAGKAAIAKAASRVHRNLDNIRAVAATIPKARVAALRKNPLIALVEPDSPRYNYGSSDPSSFLRAAHRQLQETAPYGISMVQADQVAHDAANRKTVCVMDSGYSMGHPDLPTTGVSGYAVSTANWTQDGCGHGTHVAGTIAATKGNGVGVVGVAPGVDLFIVRVFDDSCHWAYASSLIDALNRCTSGGADIVSMSLGCTGTYCRSTAEQAAYDQAYANGVLSIAAAGNDGTGNFSYPASYGSVVSVAAVDSSGTVASFSQKNDQVELAAPGVGVRSTVPGGYASWSGTSMATPHVSGVSALIWSNFPDASNVQIREALDATALDKGPPGRDTSYGFGIVQAKAAFDYLTAARAVPVPPPAPTPTRAPTKAPTRRPTKAPTRRPTKAPVQGQCASQGASCRLTPCCAGLRCKSRVCRL